MPSYHLKQLAAISGSTLLGKDAQVDNLLIDSRSHAISKDTLFFAIKGRNHDGHAFIANLYDRQVRHFVVSEAVDPLQLRFPEANFIHCANTLDALQAIVAHHRQQFSIPIVGITGSNGKTIVKEWLTKLLFLEKKVVRSPKSYNSQIGVPLSLWLLETKYELGIFEAGISLPKEMACLQKMIRPTIGIITNIGSAHQENFSTKEEKIHEKLLLFQEADLLIYNNDQLLVDQAIQQKIDSNNTRLFTWSRHKRADLQIMNIQTQKQQSTIEAKYTENTYQITIPFSDEASIENAIHCWAFLIATKLFRQAHLPGFASLPPVAMQLEIKQGVNQLTIISDSYNSDLNSLQIALDLLHQQNQHAYKTLVLSDILQSGEDEFDLYDKVARIIFQSKIDQLICIGENIQKHVALFASNSKFYRTTADFLIALKKKKPSNQAILLKGAWQFEFEKISTELQQQANKTVLEIHLDALVHNLNYFRAKLYARTKIMVMVKAFSYGSGNGEIANLLQHHRVDYLGVAIADEGVELRKLGICTPILVMNPEIESFEKIIEYQLEPEIYNFQMLAHFAKTVNNSGLHHFPIHIKLDTGMKRLGFEEKDILVLQKELLAQNQLRVQSVFSHLAGTDEAQHDAFTWSQIKLFDRLSTEIIQTLNYPVLRHVLNSSGIERFPEAQFDMVRLGIGLYGISPSKQNKLRNISTLRTTISQIKQVDANETVGYGRKGKVSGNSVIGIIPIGYADGLKRRLSNGVGYVWVAGQYAPFIGNICMDMSMIDLTGIEANEGDLVVIFGDELPIWDIAKQLQTIPYEILTSISRRVKRVYFQS